MSYRCDGQRSLRRDFTLCYRSQAVFVNHDTDQQQEGNNVEQGDGCCNACIDVVPAEPQHNSRDTRGDRYDAAFNFDQTSNAHAGYQAWPIILYKVFFITTVRSRL